MILAKRRSKDKIARAWHLYWAAPENSPTRTENKWVHSYLTKTLRKSPEENWEQILEILASTPSKENIRKLAANPLRDLLNKHFEKFRERIEVESKLNKRLLYALGKTFVFNETNQKELKRIRESNGPRSIELNLEPIEFDKEEMLRLASACKRYWSAPSDESTEQLNLTIEEAVNLRWENAEKLWELIVILLRDEPTLNVIHLTSLMLLSPLLSADFDDFIGPLSNEVANCPAFLTALNYVQIDDANNFQELMRLRDSNGVR